jgi:hypothetical protein
LHFEIVNRLGAALYRRICRAPFRLARQRQNRKADVVCSSHWTDSWWLRSLRHVTIVPLPRLPHGAFATADPTIKARVDYDRAVDRPRATSYILGQKDGIGFVRSRLQTLNQIIEVGG